MAGELRPRGRVQGPFQLTGLEGCLGIEVEGRIVKHASQLVIKQMGSGAILLRGAGLLAGDDECKLGLVQFELLEGLLRAGKCQRVWTRLGFWREVCVGGIVLGPSCTWSLNSEKMFFPSSMKPSLLPPVAHTQS